MLDGFLHLIGRCLLHLLHARCGTRVVVIVSGEPPEIVGEGLLPMLGIGVEVVFVGNFALRRDEVFQRTILSEYPWQPVQLVRARSCVDDLSLFSDGPMHSKVLW